MKRVKADMLERLLEKAHSTLVETDDENLRKSYHESLQWHHFRRTLVRCILEDKQVRDQNFCGPKT